MPSIGAAAENQQQFVNDLNLPPVLTVDRACLQCSGNPSGVLIHQFKLACLSYTQSPIRYQQN